MSLATIGNLKRRVVLLDANGNPLSSDLRGTTQALAVEIVDASGNQITSFGSSTVSANQGTAAANSGKWPIAIIDSDNTDNSLSTGGQIGQKVQVVGDSEKFVRGAQADNSAQVGGPVVIGLIGATGAPTAGTTGNAKNVWGDTNGRLHITGDTSMVAILSQGDTGSGSTDSGNPLKIGGVFVTTPATFTNNQRANLLMDNNGRPDITMRPAALGQTGTAAAGTGVTVTLGAGGAGLYHHICYIEIVLYASVAIVGAAAPIVVTSTNLNGANAWTFPTADAIGTVTRYVIEPTTPIRSSVANTATTIVCPATTSVIWRVNVFYYVSSQT